MWDIVDDLSFIHKWGDKDVLHKNHVFKHWYQRLQYYKKQGFNFVTRKINTTEYYTQEDSENG